MMACCNLTVLSFGKHKLCKTIRSVNRPQGHTLFSCSIQLNLIFQLLIKAKVLKIKTFLTFKVSYVVFIMLIKC